MKELIIIPDVHGRDYWKNAVKGKEDQKIIFLGDYVDPYPAEKISWEQTIVNFEEIIDFKKKHLNNVVLLLGNHDLGYVLGKEICECRRSERFASDITNLFMSDIDLFKLAHVEYINEKRFVFSHAGLTYNWFRQHSDLLIVNDVLNKNVDPVDFVNENFNNGKPEPWFKSMLSDYSRFRGWLGLEWGSVIWMDVREWFRSTVEKTEGYQIFGHSQLNNTGEAIITDKFADLDCRSAFVLNKNRELKVIENECKDSSLE